MAVKCSFHSSIILDKIYCVTYKATLKGNWGLLGEYIKLLKGLRTALQIFVLK